MSKDYMAIISPQQVVAGTEIQATDVNNPINTITNLVNGNLSSDNIAAGGVSSTNLAQDSVTVSELADDAVGTSNIIDAAVTADKLSPDFVSALGDYSYDETATPFSWVDGAKIYRITINGTVSAAANVRTATTILTNPSIKHIIKSYGWWAISPNYEDPINSTTASTTQMSGLDFNTSTGVLQLISLTATVRTNMPYSVTIEYTKTS